MNSIGIIGIGAMGKRIAKNLLKAGFPLHAYFRNTIHGKSTATELENSGAIIVDTLSEMFANVEVLLLCVPDSNIVEELLIGEKGLSNHLNPSVRTVLDLSTSHPESTKKIAEILKTKGISILDAPMTGSVREAEAGTLKLIVGGDKDLFEENKALFDSISEIAYYAGSQGAGNLVKLANNYLAILDQTVTAGIAIVLDQYEIPIDVYNTFLTGSSANSGGFRLMMNRIKTGDFDLKFGLGLATKDIGYCKDVFPLSITDTLYATLKDASDAGYRDKDIGTIYYHLKNILLDSIPHQ